MTDWAAELERAARQQGEADRAAGIKKPNGALHVIDDEIDDISDARPESFSNDLLPNGRWGYFHRIYDDTLGHSLRPQPILALGTTLALISRVVGNHFFIRELNDLRLNLFIVNIGPTGSGKNDPQRHAKKLLREIGFVPLDRVASHQGLEDEIFRDPRQIVISDEGQKLFATMHDKSSYSSGIIDSLLHLYSASNSSITERVLARDRRQRRTPPTPPRTMNFPYLVIHLSSTPEAIEVAVSEHMAAKGLLNRLLFFQSDERRPEPQFSRPQTDVSLQHLRTICAPPTDPWLDDSGIAIELSPEVQEIYRSDKITKDALAWSDRQSDPSLAHEIMARVQENAFRIAGLIAVCDWIERGRPAQSIISDAIFDYALKLVWWATTQFSYFATKRIGLQNSRNPVVRVRKWLHKQREGDAAQKLEKDGWRPIRALYRAMSLKAREMEEIIKTLERSGEVEIRDTVNRNQRKVQEIRLR